MVLSSYVRISHVSNRSLIITTQAEDKLIAFLRGEEEGCVLGGAAVYLLFITSQQLQVHQRKIKHAFIVTSTSQSQP